MSMTVTTYTGLEDSFSIQELLEWVEGDKEVIFTVNHEGWASLAKIRDGKIHALLSRNQVEGFLFRGCDYHDGRIMSGLTEWELNYIANAFDLIPQTID